MELYCTLLCSAGLYLQYDGAGLLVDALNGPWAPYKQLPDETAARILAGENGFAGARGAVFTHRHPDHCRESLAEAFLRAHPGAQCFLPDERTPESLTLEIGPFTVECRSFVHTPIPYALVPHYVLYVTAGEKSVYITADAAPDCARHRAILAGRRADAAFWNGQYLSYPETRQLMAEAARQNYIYHLPEDPHNGVRRKCERNFARCAGELTTVSALTDYPTSLKI